MDKKSLLLIPAAAAFVSCGTQSVEKPNIIFILADDMGYGDVSFLDHNSKLNTVNLDKMASEGAVLTDAHTSSSVSTPTRYGVLTGRYNWRSTLKSNVLNGYSKALIEEDRSTMATMLGKAGYTTAGIGKWHLGWDWNNVDAGNNNVDFSKPVTNGPTDRGFDYYFGFCGSLDMPPYVYIENDMPTAEPDRVTVGTRPGWWRKGPTAPDFVHEQVLPELITRACNYIDEKSKGEEPFFLYLPLPAPHTPILPIDEFKGMSGLGDYGDFVLMVDAMVGRIFTALEAAGCDENTLVVFTTDNGCSPAAGIPALIEQGHYPNSIYRGHKADLYDGGHRVPCIVRWPAKIKHHTVDQTICLTDFYATFAKLAGYNI
ncbi:MAG: arylsulfatase, partial [Rikenellaceae bacterium]